MVFLTLFAVGALAAWLTGRLQGVETRQDPALGAAGAFLLGGLAVGLAGRSPGMLDPLILALGAIGGVGAVLLGTALERRANDAARRRP